MSIGANIAGRCHVWDSNMQVIRAVRKAMAQKQRRDPKLRTARHSVYRDALEAHAANRALFYALAKGDLG